MAQETAISARAIAPARIRLRSTVFTVDGVEQHGKEGAEEHQKDRRLVGDAEQMVAAGHGGGWRTSQGRLDHVTSTSSQPIATQA